VHLVGFYVIGYAHYLPTNPKIYLFGSKACHFEEFEKVLAQKENFPDYSASRARLGDVTPERRGSITLQNE
jgi:hypothetical protein